MSKMPAMLPPTWRWIVTAVTTKETFFEPIRVAISASASSIGRPSRVSVSTRLNSLLAGGWPSSTTAWIPWRKLWPAFSEAASVTSRSGSWSSIAASRRFALHQTTTIGTAPPTSHREQRHSACAAPATAKTIPARSPEPAAA